MKKIISFLSLLSLLLNTFIAPMSALAQEVSPSPTSTPEEITTPEPTQIPEVIPTPGATTNPEASSEPTPPPLTNVEPITIPITTPESFDETTEKVSVPSAQLLLNSEADEVEKVCLTDGQEIKDSANEDWDIDNEKGIAETKEKVKLGVKYIFPQENNVSVTFKCLPKDEGSRTSLKIQRVKISDLNFPEDVNPYGEYAYDITTGMTDGTFEYDISLPFSEESSEDVTVKYAESVDSLENIKEVEEEKSIDGDKITIEGLDHFTVFIIVTDDGAIYTGTWIDYATQGYSDDGVHYPATVQAGKTATWTFSTITAGSYNVYVSWSTHANRTTSAPYTLNHTEGAYPFTVNQEKLADQTTTGGSGQWSGWYKVGTYNLSSSSNLVLTSVDNSSGTDYVIADEVLLAPNIAPDTVWVDDDYTINSKNDGHVWGYDAFDTIQEGINAVSAAGTVNVAAGTYTEVDQIVIDKDLSIIGADKTTTIIKPAQDTGSSGDSRGWFLVQAGVTFNLSNVTLDGDSFKVHQAIRSLGAGTINNNIIKNIKYSQYVGLGMVVMGDYNMTFSNNTFSNIERIGMMAFGPGVTNAEISGNIYTGKGEGDWLDYGIEVGAGAHATITNNVISGNIGVATTDSSTSAGILATTHWGNGTTVTITGNTISNCTDGIAVGYDANDTSVVVAHNNKLGGNVNGVNSTKPLVDATNNWWGDASGPKDTVSGDNSILDTNPSGIGSAAIGAVKYSPWYKDEGMTTLTSPSAITNTATGIGLYDATLNGANGDYAATGHSFWVSLTSFSTASPNIPNGVYSTPDMGSIAANKDFSASLLSLTTEGVPSNMPAIKPNTTYYYVAWARVGGIRYPGHTQTFTTLPIPVPAVTFIANGVNVPTNGYTNSEAFTFHLSSASDVTRYQLKYWNDIPGSSYKESSPWSPTDIAGYMNPFGTYNDKFTQGEGKHYFSFSACDAAGNCSAYSTPFVITYDKTAPHTPSGLYYEANGKVLSCNSSTDSYNITAKWGASSDTNFSNYEYRSFNPPTGWIWNGGNIGNTLSRSGAFTVGEGTYGFAVRAVDKAGNASDWTSENLADSCKITYDKTSPTITDLAVDENYVKAGDVLTITANVTDSSGIAAVSADFSYNPEYTNRPTPTSVGMTKVSGNTYSVAYTVPTSWNEGTMHIKVAARDNTGGNWVRSSSSKQVVVDNTDPSGSWVNPVNDATISGTVTLNFSATDALSDLSSKLYQYKVDDAVDTFHNITGNSWDTTGLTLGDYIVRAEVTDKAGNVADFDITVGVAAVISGQNAVGVSTGSITVTWTTDRQTTSRVVYDTTSHPTLGTGDNYGYAYSTTEDPSKVTSHSVTISGLSSGGKYYYRVISHGSPVAISGEGSAATLSNAGPPMVSGGEAAVSILGVTASAPSATPRLAYVTNVAEEESEKQGETSEDEEKQTPEILGASDDESKGSLSEWIGSHIGLLLGLLALIAITIYLIYKKSKKKNREVTQ